MTTPAYIFLVLVTLIFIGAYFILGLFAVFGYYLFVGFLIWITCDGRISFIKTLLFWYIAMLINKPEIVD